MSTLTIQLPESLKETIEALAARAGYSVSQFLASAAGEKLAVVLTMDYLRREAAAGRREDFRMRPRNPVMNSENAFGNQVWSPAFRRQGDGAGQTLDFVFIPPV